jgi:hypothetical protein
MLRLCVVGLMVGIGISLAASAATVASGPFVDPSNGHTYYMLTPDTWTISQLAAQALGGNLATVRNSSENQWIDSTFGSSGDFLWLGLYDPITGDGTGATHAADFRWIDGETSTYRNWNPVEPNNDPGNGGEYYTAMATTTYLGLSPLDWNDLSNTAFSVPPITAAGIIEIIPEPSPIALLTAAALLLFRGVGKRRRRKLEAA